MQKIKTLITIFTIAFLLNLIWENAQAPLYQGYVSFWQHFLICLPASLWDAVYITIVYLALTFLHKNLLPIQKMSDRTKSVLGIPPMIVVTILGLFTASIIELRTLAQNRWAYTAAMPLVPIIHIGLTPFLQLALLSLITYRIVERGQKL